MVAVAQARQAVHTRLLTPFFGKLGQKGIREAADGKQSTIGRLKEEKNGQQDSPIVRRAQC
jgi:hypothetical protein